MKIMFVKDYIDIDTFHIPVFIEQTTEAILLDEVTGKVFVEEFNITLEDVSTSFYAPLTGESY